MTKTKKHHWLFKLWIKIRGLLAVMVVLAGLAVGVLSLLLPFEFLYQDRLEKFLQQQWGLEVQLEEVDGSWQGYGPYFLLSNLKLTGKQSIQLESANLSINIYQLLIPGGRTGIDLSINKAELDMIHSAEGANITINNDADEARFTEMLDNVLTTGSLRVDEMVINLANDAGDVLLSGLKADLLLEQDNVQRALELLVKNETADESIEIKSIGLKTQSLTKDAHWYLNFSQFSLNQLNDLLNEVQLPKGQVDGALWLTAESGAITATNGLLSWVNESRNLTFEVLIKQIGQGNEWQALLVIQNILIDGHSYHDVEINLQKEAGVLDLMVSDVPIKLLVNMVTDMVQDLDSGVMDFAQVDGVVANFQASYDLQQESWIGGELDFKEVLLEHQKYQLNQLTGSFQFNQSMGQVLIDSVAGSMAFPDIYRDQLQWQELSAQLDINWAGGKPLIQVNNLWCQCTDFNLQAWSEMAFDDVMNLKLNSRLSDVDVKSLYKYWPYNVWNPKTIDWLDRSLLSGEVKTGFVFVNGDMVPKAFNHGDADFISRAYTENVDNQFHPSWPMVEQIDAIAVFDHDQIEVAVQQAETKGIEVSNAQVNIDSLDEGILSVNLNASSQNNELLEYVQASPLAKNLSLNETIRIAGKQQIDLDFDVSIKSEVNQAFNPQGVINFSAGQFLTTFFSINEINGPVSLDGYQIKLHDLPAQLNGADVMLDGTILTQSPHGVAVDVNLSGNLSADYLLEVVEQNLPISGQSDWLINIKNDMDELVMTAQSALAGVSIMLPPPLDKVAEESKDLEIKCKLPCQQSLVDINYNNQIKSTLSRVANQYHLTRLQFVTEDTVLATNTALFGGHLEHVDLDQWLTLLAQPTSEAGTGSEQNSPWPVNEINLDIKQLTFMSREFTDISLHIVRLADSYEINIDSESMKGRVILDDDLKQKGIVAEFEHLNWIDATIAVDDTEPESTDSSIPDIHLWAEQFSYAGVPLGAFRMEMRNVADGINFELLSLKSELAEVNISGTWNKAIGDDGFSSFNIVMFSERIADFLQTVGFSAPITNAQTLIEMKAQWAGVPSQFNIANIDGDLNIKIGQGQVLDQQPGFGRVLGLFNLTNLPRRLILDFSDVLADGLLFRSMEGHFVIKSGVANTQDFLIKASSAKIHINGDVGFADQSYAQTITINPQIGKTFPTLGAIAGGPVGAAAGFLVQGLFDKQLKNKNEIIYRVTGTWDDPLIELISDE